MQNLPLTFLDTAKPFEVSYLSPQDLLFLSKQLHSISTQLKRRQSVLEAGVKLKFGETAQEKLRHTGRNTGTVRFTDHDYIIVATLPKKVIWEQDQLFTILKKIPIDEHQQYVKATYAIDERKYLSWSTDTKSLFDSARIVQVGKPKFQITNGGNS
jgi:hypothetical protein